jgi:hypothetical protein
MLQIGKQIFSRTRTLPNAVNHQEVGNGKGGRRGGYFVIIRRFNGGGQNGGLALAVAVALAPVFALALAPVFALALALALAPDFAPCA